MIEGISKALWIVVATVFAAAASIAPVVRGQIDSCYFVFGDSLFDNGSNNDSDASAEVNNLPYGIDFPQGPTGRFSNGRNIADFIAELAGFNNTIPPFRAVSRERANIGMNYASGAGKIRDIIHWRGRLSLRSQIDNHQWRIIKEGLPRRQLKQCLYIFSFGSYDYLDARFYTSRDLIRNRKPAEQFAERRIFFYKKYLNEIMYQLGARKVVLFGIGQIGCTPRTTSLWGFGGCVGAVNQAVEIFNKKLQTMVAELNKQLSGAKFTYVDLFSGYDKAVTALGIEVGGRSCCTLTPREKLCAVNGTICPDRTKYLFWDGLHTTETINAAVANLAFNGSITSPFSISHLVNIKWPF
ncbi:hypothetical protein N665_0046s0087 [Sinapis alba]|nr:hypothetical protein N665_0046s0087 [Sinapis alba]